MKNSETSLVNIIKWLDELYPDKLPTKNVDQFTLGRLIGQREVIEQIKMKVAFEGDKPEEIK